MNKKAHFSFEKGNNYFAQQDYQRAIELYSAALEFNDSHAYTYVNRGNSYYQLGSYELAGTD